MNSRDRSYRLGVDVGGTFTDLVVNDTKTGALYHTKTPSTPENPEQGTTNGVRKVLEQVDITPQEVSTLIHGTTVATNAVIERRGARAGLIVTEGIRDVLEIRRQNRPHLYDFRNQKEPPVIPRERIFETQERILPDGSIQTELSDDEVYEIVDKIEAEAIDSIGICLLHSYINDEHEQRIKQILEAKLPDVKLSVSSEILPKFKEYERMSTTAINAFLMPVMDSYIDELRSELIDIGVEVPLHIMQSNGGIMSADAARERCVQTIVSGPAAGALSGKVLTDRDNFITADMGGTSFDIALSHDNELEFTDESNLSGHVIHVPQIKISTIGAGGGSIAWVDDGGALRVGPRSSGADPGPIAYGNGGTEPTVTDAHVVLGRLNQEALLNGEMEVNLRGAEKGIKDTIADPLDLSVMEAAQGIIDVVNANMIKSMRVISVERGYDPRDFSLISFGGAGPLHSAELAAELDMSESIIPYAPGVNSAIGLLAADYRKDYVETYLSAFEETDFGEIRGIFSDLMEEAVRDLESQEHAEEEITFVPTLQMRYRGQGYDLGIPIELDDLTSEEPAESIKEAFNRRHEREYGFSRPDESIQIANLNLSAISDSDRHRIDQGPQSRESTSSTKTSRDVYFDGEMYETPIYQREALSTNAELTGPTIVEQSDSTIVIPPGFECAVDDRANLVIERAG